MSNTNPQDTVQQRGIVRAEVKGSRNNLNYYHNSCDKSESRSENPKRITTAFKFKRKLSKSSSLLNLQRPLKQEKKVSFNMSHKYALVRKQSSNVSMKCDEDPGNANVGNVSHNEMEAGILFTAAAIANQNGGVEGGGTVNLADLQKFSIPLSIEDVQQQQKQDMEEEEEHSLTRTFSSNCSLNSIRKVHSSPSLRGLAKPMKNAEFEIHLSEPQKKKLAYFNNQMNKSESSNTLTTQGSKDSLTTMSARSHLQQDHQALDMLSTGFVPSMQYRFEPPEFNANNFSIDMNPHEFIQTVLKCKFLFDVATNDVLHVPALDSVMNDFFLEVTDEHFEAYDKNVLDAVHRQDIDKLRSLHREGKNLQCCNRFGESLLHMVCRRGFVEMAMFLVHEAGVSLRVKDDCGRTPLHDACWATLPAYELVELLIAVEPDLLIISDKRGHTPFQYARREHWHHWRKFLYDRWNLISVRSPSIISRIANINITKATQVSAQNDRDAEAYLMGISGNV